MADHVQVPADGVGKKVDAREFTRGPDTVYRQRVIPASDAVTAVSPAAATVGTSSASAVASNANRKGVILVNTSTAWISLGLGATAVLYSGITLAPGAAWEMRESFVFTGEINAIASATSSNLAVQEFT